MSKPRKIVVCADDAGWDEASDECLTGHAQRQEISAISLLVNGQNAGSWAEEPQGDTCSLGLHLAFTWSPQNGSHGLPRLLLDSYLKRLSQHTIDQAIDQQLKRFETLTGGPPAFVDGHQHVHALPLIRDQLLHALEKRYTAEDRPSVRATASQCWRGSKAWVLNRLGGRALARSLNQKNWRCNRDFAGVYSLSHRADFRQLMQGWLRSIHEHGLIMVHPGSSDNPEHGLMRAAESQYLASQAWGNDRAAALVELSRL